MSFLFLAVPWCVARMAIAQEPTVTADDLMKRVYLQNGMQRTFEARFRARKSGLIARSQDESWEAHYYYQAPDRYRIDYWPVLNSELRVSEATLGGDSPRRTLRYDPERPPNGTIEQNPGVGSSSGPNVSRFFYHFYLRACQDRRADFSTWNIRRAKGRVFLSGESVDPGTTTTLELDADQDFAIVSMRSEFRGSGNVLVNTYEHVKVQDQFWVPAFATSTQRDKLGQVIVEFQYEIDINTVRVNQPIEGSIFDLEFPKGTRVYDALTKQSYFVGGDSRSSGDLQELLAKAEQMSGSPPSAIQPSPGALRAKRLSWSTVAFYSTLGITGLVLAVCGMMIRRRSGYSR